MRPPRLIDVAGGELGVLEPRVDLHYADLALDNGETHPPFFDGELHPLIQAADPAIRMGLRAQSKRRLDTLADRESRLSLNPTGLLLG